MIDLRDRILRYLLKTRDPWRTSRALFCLSSGRTEAIVKACRRFLRGDRPVVVLLPRAENVEQFQRACGDERVLVTHFRLAASASKGLSGARGLRRGRGGRRLDDAGGWSNRFAEKVVLVDGAHSLVESAVARESSEATRRDLRTLARLLSEEHVRGTSVVGFFTDAPLPTHDSELRELLDVVGDASVTCAIPFPCARPEPVTVPTDGAQLLAMLHVEGVVPDSDLRVQVATEPLARDRNLLITTAEFRDLPTEVRLEEGGVIDGRFHARPYCWIGDAPEPGRGALLCDDAKLTTRSVLRWNGRALRNQAPSASLVRSRSHSYLRRSTVPIIRAP